MLARRYLAGLLLALLPGVSGAEEKEGMPQLDPHSYASQIFWLAMFFILVLAFLRFVGLPRVTAILEERRSRIDGDIGQAGQLRVQADQALKAYEATLADAHGQARKLLAETHEKNAATLADQTRVAAVEFDKRVTEAVGRVETARAAALQGLREAAIGLAADITTKVAGRAPAPESVIRAIDEAAKVGVA
jgi:F-type H+-transporting ATPase subunit b